MSCKHIEQREVASKSDFEKNNEKVLQTINIVETAIRKYSLLSNGNNIIVALSGGADSVTLLNILNSIKEKYHLTLFAAHLNHGIRGEEADNDEKFCKILCKNYNIKFFVKHIDIPKLCAEKKISEELCGRIERYKFFDELSSQLNAKVATAHTASDNAETLLFNLTRGSSISGAAAIPPKRKNIIRPLIELTRADIEAYCEAKSLAYVTDSTNLTETYTRNKIRLKAVPVLKEINPEAERSMLSFSRDCDEVGDYLRQSAEDLLNSSKEKYGYSSKKLLNSHPAVLKSAIAMLCSNSFADAERRHINLIIEILKNGGAVELKNGKKAVCAQKILRIVSNHTDINSFYLVFDKNMSFEYNGKQIDAKADFSLIKDKKPVFRTRQSGDYFTFCERNIKKPLRKALNEQKIPSELRDNLLTLCADNTILWCEGLGLSKQGREINIEINIL